MLDATETAKNRFGKYMIWWNWLRKAIILTISFGRLSIDSKRVATIMDTTTTGYCKRSIKLLSSVEDNNHSNSCRYSSLFIFDCLFFSPFFSWLLALIFFQFSSACNVITLTTFLSFYVSLKHTFFFYVEWMCLSLKLNNNMIPRLGLDRLVQT